MVHPRQSVVRRRSAIGRVRYRRFHCNYFSADDSCDDSASSDASEYCSSHEDETSDESTELLLTEESEFGCQDNPDYCPTHQHQCKTVVYSLQSRSSTGTPSVSVVEGPESQEVARSAPKKRKIPVGIVLPNQVSFMEFSQLETLVDSINKIRGCKTSKCDGNLVPIFVRSVGLGGCIHIRFGCNGCRSKQAVFETYSQYKHSKRSNCISLSVQVAFIMAGGTHAVYAKTLSHALGMKTVHRVTYLKTDILDRMCETAKTDMKAKNDHELGSWKRAVTTADGT